MALALVLWWGQLSHCRRVVLLIVVVVSLSSYQHSCCCLSKLPCCKGWLLCFWQHRHSLSSLSAATAALLLLSCCHQHCCHHVPLILSASLCSTPALTLLGMGVIDVSSFLLSLRTAPFDGKGLLQLQEEWQSKLSIFLFLSLSNLFFRGQRTPPTQFQGRRHVRGSLWRDRCHWFGGGDLTCCKRSPLLMKAEDLSSLVFLCWELQTHNFGATITHISDAPMQLHCQPCELAVLSLQILYHGVWFWWQWRWMKSVCKGKGKIPYLRACLPNFVCVHWTKNSFFRLFSG
jgi:hypothetical protein